MLEEDGTAGEAEEYFGALAEGTVLQKVKPPSEQGSGHQLSLSHLPARKISETCITSYLPKVNFRDLTGSLNLKAAFYGICSLSYGLHGYGTKPILKETLCWAPFSL